ncbi:MAG TPA: MFS transporter [Xanthobacteraceae bacterium]
MSKPPVVSKSRLLDHRSFVLFWHARTFSNGAFMMQGVAIAWQIYELTDDPLDLGLVGLVQFFPVVTLSILIGQVADRLDRRRVAGFCQIAKALTALALALGSAGGWLGRDSMLALLFLSATARAFELPAMQALLPGLVPPVLLPRAIAASAGAQQTAVICGPSLGGLLYGLGPTVVYAVCTVVFVAASVLIGGVQLARKSEPQPFSIETLFAGFSYILRRPVLFGAISLDLVAVLLGGVTALLPIYARDILDAGPWALGLLRSAPAVGALTASIVLARHAITGSAGKIMFAAVGAFGAASVLFALSTSIPMSMLALAIYGAADAVSVVIRLSFIQMRTPHDMLGRVMAVNSMFTGSSGSLGEFRAGVVAAWLGAVPSALMGGIGAIIVMLIWMGVFPQLRRIDRLAPEGGPTR